MDVHRALHAAFSPFLVSVSFHDASGDEARPGTVPASISVVHEVPWDGRELLDMALAVPEVVACLLDPSRIHATGNQGNGAVARGAGRQALATSPDPPRAIQSGRVAVLDIETLGLQDVPVIAVGLGSLHGDLVRVEQHLLLDASHEGTFLERILARVAFQDTGTLVSFNGKRFDVPFLVARAKATGAWRDNGIDAIPHVDLFPAFKVLRPGLARYAFGVFETVMLGLGVRQDDIEGKDMPRLHAAILNDESTTGDQPGTPGGPVNIEPAFKILRHNFFDILHATFGLTAVIEEILKRLGIPALALKDRALGSMLPVATPAAGARFPLPGGDDLVHEALSDGNGDRVPRVMARVDPWHGGPGGAIDRVADEIELDRHLLSIEKLLHGPLPIGDIRGLASRKAKPAHAYAEAKGWFLFLEAGTRRGLLARTPVDGKICYGPSTPGARDPPVPDAGDIDASPIPSTRQEPDLDVTIQPAALLGDQPEPAVSGMQEGPMVAMASAAGQDATDTCCNGENKVMVRRTRTSVPVRRAREASTTPAPGAIEPAVPRAPPGIFPARSTASLIPADPVLPDVVRGWLVACGHLVVGDAARCLGIDVPAVMALLFREIGAGTVHARFKDGIFVVDDPAAAGDTAGRDPVPYFGGKGDDAS